MQIETADTMPDGWKRWLDWHMTICPDNRPEIEALQADCGESLGYVRLVGRRVEVRVDQREITAVVLDTGELACRHTRVFAKHRTITAIDHARAHRDRRRPQDEVVEVRPLARYDALIA